MTWIDHDSQGSGYAEGDRANRVEYLMDFSTTRMDHDSEGLECGQDGFGANSSG